MSTPAARLQLDIAKYEMVHPLGRGAFSDVLLYQLKGEGADEPKRIAVKMPRQDHSLLDRKRDGEYLVGEAQVLKKIAADEQARELVVNLYFSGPHPLSGETCLALDAFIPEDGWHQLDKAVPELSLGEALQVLRKIVQLLRVQQKLGIINPDLKADSFFIKREPELLVRATDFNTTTEGAVDSPEWQKVRRGLAEIMSYVLSQGRFHLFLAYTHDQQPDEGEITAEEDRVVPTLARGLTIASLQEKDFDRLEALLQEVQQKYQEQLKGLIDQALEALQDGDRENAQKILWEEILKKCLPVATVSKAREQMLLGNVDPTLDMVPKLPSELRGVPWLTVWAHLVAPPASLIKERQKSEFDSFIPVYHHFLRSLRDYRMGDALCCLYYLLAPLPYDGSFASWLEQREKQDIKNCRPIYAQIANTKKGLLSQEDRTEGLPKRVIRELDKISAELADLPPKLPPCYEGDEGIYKWYLEDARELVKKAQESPAEAGETLFKAVSEDLNYVCGLIDEENADKVEGLKASLAEVAKLAQEANEPKKGMAALLSRQRELINQL